MLSLGRRSAAFVGGATCMAALAALVIATTPHSSAQGLGAAATTRAAAQAPAGIAARPPLGRPKPSGQAADFHPADSASSSSPWTALKNAPPFGTPGTMLLESDGTVLVHNEPDNNTTGGTNQWWKLTPAANGSYVNGTWSQIASMPSDYAPLYFASAVLPDGRMIVEGGEYNGDNAVWSDQGEIYNPVTNTWRVGRAAERLDGHRGRGERGSQQRHLHAPAPVQQLRQRMEHSPSTTRCSTRRR